MLVNENRWRAQRYGVDAGLVDFGKGEVVPYAELLEEMIAADRARIQEAFGCQAEVEQPAAILARGTSAHRQLAAYHAALAAGATPRREALEAVVDMLIAGTLEAL